MRAFFKQSKERQRVERRLLGAFRKLGWYRSVELRMPVDNDGEPLPWYTYPLIQFLEPRVGSGWNVFEFGSGNSTLWWSKRVASVMSCEHDPEWFGQMEGKFPPNVTYRLHRLTDADDYIGGAKVTEGPYDCIVIDGRERTQCAKRALSALSANGIFVWDNSDREQYAEGYAFLLEQGFRRIDFWGFGPLNSEPWCTSVFYRQNNCLGI